MFVMSGIGIALVGAGAGLWSSFGDQQSLLVDSKELPFSTVIGPPAPEEAEDWGTITASLRTSVEYPSQVASDRSFLVALKLEIDKVQFVPIPRRDIGLLGGATGPVPDFDESRLRTFVASILRSQDLSFTLMLAGAEVQPKEKNPLSEAGRTWWSVKAKASGRLEGFLRPNFPRRTGGHGGKHRVAYEVDDHIPIAVDAHQRIFTRPAIVSWIGGFFGSLLTLPGLLAFIEQRRARRKKRQDEESRIITDI